MFVAVTPPQWVREDLEAFLEPRQEAAAFRWTAPEAWHLTLAFMGEVAEHTLDELVERLGAAAARRTPVTLRLAGGGAFPDPARAKVLYAAVDAAPEDRLELDRLAVGCRSAANRAGAATNGAAFHPHLTLARMSRPVEATRWLRVLDAYDSQAWVASEISLFESHLGEGPRGRPRYEVAASLALGTGETD